MFPRRTYHCQVYDPTSDTWILFDDEKVRPLAGVNSHGSVNSASPENKEAGADKGNGNGNGKVKVKVKSTDLKKRDSESEEAAMAVSDGDDQDLPGSAGDVRERLYLIAGTLDQGGGDASLR